MDTYALSKRKLAPTQIDKAEPEEIDEHQAKIQALYEKHSLRRCLLIGGDETPNHLNQFGQVGVRYRCVFSRSARLFRQ